MKKAPWAKLTISMKPKIRFSPSARRTSTAPLTRPMKTWLISRCTRCSSLPAGRHLLHAQGRAGGRLAFGGRDRRDDLAIAVLRRSPLARRVGLAQPEHDVGGLKGLVVAGPDVHRALGEVELGAGQRLGEVVGLVVVALDLVRDDHDRVVDIGGVATGRLAVGLMIGVNELPRAGIGAGPDEVRGAIGALDDVKAHLLVEGEVGQELEDLGLLVEAELLGLLEEALLVATGGAQDDHVGTSGLDLGDIAGDVCSAQRRPDG